MSNDTVGIFLAIAGALLTWTASVIGAIMWLSAKFNAGERLVFKENAKTREMLGRVLNQHAGRIMRLEVTTYGSTLSGKFTEGGYETTYPPEQDEDH